MEISGKLIKILPLLTGEGKNGTWKKQEFVLEIPGQFAKNICFEIWGDKISQLPAITDVDVTVFFDLESREYNNKWYTGAKAWKVSILNTKQSSEQNDAASFPGDASGLVPPEEFPSRNIQDEGNVPQDDLPF